MEQSSCTVLHFPEILDTPDFSFELISKTAYVSVSVAALINNLNIRQIFSSFGNRMLPKTSMKFAVICFAICGASVQVGAQNPDESGAGAFGQVAGETGYRIGLGVGSLVPPLKGTVGPVVGGVLKPPFALFGSLVGSLSGTQFHQNEIPWYPQSFRNAFVASRVGYGVINNLTSRLGIVGYILGPQLLAPLNSRVAATLAGTFGGLADVLTGGRY